MDDQSVDNFLRAHPIPFLAVLLCAAGLLFLYILSRRTAFQVGQLDLEAGIERAEKELAVARAMERHEAMREEVRQSIVAEATTGGMVGTSGTYIARRDATTGRIMYGNYPPPRRFERPPVRPAAQETEKPDAPAA